MGKKVLSLLLACILVMSLATAALAADNNVAGVKVMVDANTITFTDAQPQMVNGRVMLPLRQVLEVLGAKVSYENDQVNITYGDTSVDFAIGDKALSIKDGDAVSSVKIDVAPYLEQSTNRVLVPVRFISEALGFKVGWDSDDNTVVIINTAKMAQEMSGKLQTWGYLLQLPENYYETSYQTNEQMSLAFTTADSKADMNITLSQLSYGLQASGTMKLEIPLEDWLDLFSSLSGDVDTGLSAADLLVLKNLQDMEMEYRFDLSTGMFYIYSAQMNEVLQYYGVIDNPDTWLSLDYNTLMDYSGVSYDSLMSYCRKPESIESLIAYILDAVVIEPQVGDYEDITQGFAAVSEYIADDAFTKTTQNGYDVYTLNLTGDDVQDTLGTLCTYLGKVVIRCKNDKMVDYTISGDLAVKDTSAGDSTDMTVDVKGDAGLNATGKVVFTIPSVGDMNITFEATNKATNEKPQTTLPDNAPVLDLTGMMFPE